MVTLTAQSCLPMITGVPLSSAGCPLGMRHSILRYSLRCINDLSSLPVTRNTITMHHATLGGFGFDVVPSWNNCRNRSTSRSWRDEEWDEEGTHMLEDLLAAGRMYQAYQETSEREHMHWTIKWDQDYQRPWHTIPCIGEYKSHP